MGFLIDLHLHTERYSACSHIPPERLIPAAVAKGLHGLVITEHHHQWAPEELAQLQQDANENAFLLLSGFEYTSSEGDMLVYGLAPSEAEAFPPYESPKKMLAAFQARGALCIAAHPTRAGMGYDESIRYLPFDAIEVQSVNLQPHEQRLAAQLARALGRRPIASSDAHHLANVGAYATEFDHPIQGMADLIRNIKAGAFRPFPPIS